MEKPKFKFFVLNYNCNKKKVETWNIFNNISVYDETCKLCQAYFDNILEFDWFVEKLDKAIMHEEWSRREYEIFVGDAFEEDINNFEKWDCYKQVKPNIRIVASHCLDVYREYLFKIDEPFNLEQSCDYDNCGNDCCEEKHGCCCKCDEHKLTTETIKSARTPSELYDCLASIVGKEINLEEL